MNEQLLYDTSFSFALLVPMIVSLLCGGLIGAERTKSGRPAGVRTYALVCFASALAMAISNHSSFLHASVHVGDSVRTIDPTRIMQGVLSGVGFLGAGVIFREGFNVRGLTSASAIWAVSVIGILVGLGFILGGVLATALTVVVLALSSRVDEFVEKARYNRVTVAVDLKSVPKSMLLAILARTKFDVKDTTYRKTTGDDAFEYMFVVRTTSDDSEELLASALTEMPGILRFSISPNEA